jgi:hypothetical protein
MVALTVSACGGGGGGGSSMPVPATVTISGRVTFEKIPGNASGVGLDYAAKADVPARDVLVEAVKVSDRTTVSASISTDASGNYSLTVPSNTELFLRAKAEMVKTGTPAWHFRVLDNTASNALYAITGADFNSGVSAAQRNLNAPSGWGGSSYTGARAAAPFAVLDTVYQAYNLVLAANANTVFPDLELYWSKNNRPSVNFTAATGDIQTTAFSAANVANGTTAAIYILGEENVDTDEFDASVIAHEWGHYFQASFSRDDSFGGPHAADDLLDLRVAFSEGWGDSFSGMATGASVYQDSTNTGQASGSCTGLESNAPSNCVVTTHPGWYSELSVAHVLYDFFDSNADGVDSVSLGFAPIYDVMTHEMISTRALTSIYVLSAALKSRNSAAAAGIDQILGAQSIAANAPNFDDYGSGESNDAGDPSVLPIYNPIAVGASVPNVCSDNAFGGDNKLGVSKFLKFTLAATQTVTISVTGTGTSDPDFELYGGSLIASAESSTPNLETLTQQNLAAGDYVLEVFEYSNLTSAPLGRTCFTVSVN